MATDSFRACSRGDKVKFTDPEKGKIKGEVFKFVGFGTMQYLLIYGVDENGNSVKVRCYSDNETLEREA